jgi:hypothetical protein
MSWLRSAFKTLASALSGLGSAGCLLIPDPRTPRPVPVVGLRATTPHLPTPEDEPHNKGREGGGLGHHADGPRVTADAKIRWGVGGSTMNALHRRRWEVSVSCPREPATHVSPVGPAGCRASDVEPDAAASWWAGRGPPGGPVLGPFRSRSAALKEERKWCRSRRRTR